MLRTFDKSVQALILVSSIPPTSAGLMLSSSLVRRGKRTWKHTYTNTDTHTHKNVLESVKMTELKMNSITNHGV